jgi:hypothetical protein
MGLADNLNVRPARRVKYMALRNWMLLAVEELAGNAV